MSPAFSTRRPVVIAAVALVVVACTTPPDELFQQFEMRLLAAQTVNIAFHVTAEGAVTADLSGSLTMIPSGETSLSADGEFAGEPVTLRLTAEGERYTYGNTTQRTLAMRPAELEDALAIGFMRMGVLHNLARLVEAEPPDHAAGGVGAWVVVDDFAGVRLPQPGLAFAITVAGEPAGTAVLDLDANGLPLDRRQTVQLPSGEMRVVEQYSDVTIMP